MRRRLFLLASLFVVLLLFGCARGESGGFDILKFLYNPFVMIPIGIFVVYYMMKKTK